MNKTRGDEQREKLRQQFWPSEDAWTGDNEKGWFYAPRTLPLILGLIASKELSGKCDPTRVYLELWSRHMSGGVIEMKHEGDHSYASGYFGNRGIRTWQERMKLLEKNGFIKTKHIGNQRYKYCMCCLSIPPLPYRSCEMRTESLINGGIPTVPDKSKLRNRLMKKENRQSYRQRLSQ